MSTKSKLIDNRVQSSGMVVRAATVHRGSIAKALAKRAQEVEGPATAITEQACGDFIQFLANVLAHSAKDLDGAELEVVGERADDVEPRNRRDSLEADVGARMVRVRSNIQDALGSDGLKTYGLDGVTPRASRDLLSHARKVSHLLKQKPFSLAIDGVSYDSAAIAAPLDAKADLLEAAISDIEREGQELKDKIGLRETQLNMWIDDYQGIADSLTGLFRLGGRKDLSEHVRPTTRMLSGEEVAPELPGELPAVPASEPAEGSGGAG